MLEHATRPIRTGVTRGVPHSIRRRTLTVLGILSLVTVGCGPDGTGPDAASGPSLRGRPRLQATWSGGSNAFCSQGAIQITGSTIVNPGQQSTLDSDRFYSGEHKWTSSNPAVATVVRPGGQYTFTAVVTGVAPGQTCINLTVTSGVGTGTTSSYGQVRVSVPGLAVSPASVNVGPGGTQQLTVTRAIGDDGNVMPSGTITWTSQNTAVATVDANGLVTGQGAGSTTVTASLGGKSVTVPVTVPLVGSISGRSCVRQSTYGTWNAVVSGGTPPYSYQWYRNGTPVGSNSSSYYEYISSSTYSVGQEIQITMTATDANGARSPLAYYWTRVASYYDSTPACYY